MMTAWAACLLALLVCVHFLARAYSRASKQAAQRRGTLAKARVGGLAIALVVVGLGAAFIIVGMLFVWVATW
ncbi:MAG: hypothetical protein ACYTG2_04185 [Planctomycetota bacterium]|jgi:hypothetical protein